MPGPYPAFSPPSPTDYLLMKKKEEDEARRQLIEELGPEIAPNIQTIAPGIVDVVYPEDQAAMDRFREEEDARPVRARPVPLVDNLNAEGIAARQGRRTSTVEPAAVDETAIAATATTPAETATASERARREFEEWMAQPRARQSALTEPQRGAVPDILGVDSETGYSRDARLRQAREAYGDRQPSHRWEDEFLRMRRPLSDSEYRARSGLYAFTMNNEEQARMREEMRRDQASYLEGLAKARAADVAESPASLAEVQLVAGSGVADPRAAAAMPRGDKALQAAASGAYSQGLRAEGQAQRWNIEAVRTQLALLMQENKFDQAKELAMRSGITQREIAEIYAKAKGAIDPTDPRIMQRNVGNVYEMFRKQGVSYEDAERAVRSHDFSGIPDAVRDIVRSRVLTLETLSDKASERIATAPQVAASSHEERLRFATELVVEKAKHDPKIALEMQNDLEDTAATIKAAISGWNRMTPEGKKAFVTLSSQGWTGAIQDYFSTDEDLANATAVRAMLNELVKERSGSAVTGSEWDRIAGELGLAKGTWAPFNSEKAIEAHMRRAADRARRHYDNYARLYEWE